MGPWPMRKYNSFDEFWPFYLRQHAKAGTRAFHYAGTTIVVLVALAALLTGTFRLLIAMPAAGYAFAWASHAAIERNRPATFTYPGWSLAADFKMWWLWLAGRLDSELAAAGVRPDGKVDRPHGE